MLNLRNEMFGLRSRSESLSRLEHSDDRLNLSEGSEEEGLDE